MTNYQVFVTPLKATGVYATEVEISDWVLNDQWGDVTRAIDSTNYDIGIYAFNDVNLILDASDGYLNDQNDSRSIFQFSRDLAKVRIVFLKDGVALTTFRGIINEEGTSIDIQNGTVSLIIMGYDSVFRKALVAQGAVTDGMSFQNAFIAILNSAVGGVVSVNALNINPVYNGTVDIGKAFDNKTAKAALDALLLPSNSILKIDVSGTVAVQSRADSGNSALLLHGKGDLLGRENATFSNYNTGLQRCFNRVRVTGAQASATVSGTTVSQPALVGVAQDGASITAYGLRAKDLTLDFITQLATLNAIAAALLLEFRYPKAEVEATVSTELIQAQVAPTDLLDLVSVNYPLSVRPLPNCRLPFIGITSVGDALAPLPYTEGAVVIDPYVAWKVIEIRENPKDFTTVLKLRVRGSTQNDGYFGYLMTETGPGSILQTESGGNIII